MLQRLKLYFLFVAVLSFPATGWAQSTADYSLEGEMVHIPSGHFLFGTNKKDEAAEALSLGIPKPWYADETPQQKIFLKGFYIDTFEVTNERYKKFVDDVGAIPPGNWKDKNYPEGKAKEPVTWVTWFDAANFCQWANKMLPTEKQWERAAKGNGGNEYPWGNEFQPEFANLSKRAGSKNKPVAVGSFPKSATKEGVHDLVGNVWEWVNDDYKPFKGSTYKSEYYDSGYKVLRGHSASDIGHFPGALYDNAIKMFARSGHRQFANPDEPGPDLGFRCASENKPVTGKTGLSFASNTTTSESSKKVEAVAKSLLGDSAPKEKTPFNPFAPKSNLPDSGILVLTLLAFIAGVFSFLSPCTLPILPAYFAVTAQTDRARMGMMSLAFFFGLATLFVAMGASASALGQLLRDYMFQISQIGGAIVVVFGVMTLFGKGFFPGPASRENPHPHLLASSFLVPPSLSDGLPVSAPFFQSILMLAASEKNGAPGNEPVILLCGWTWAAADSCSHIMWEPPQRRYVLDLAAWKRMG